MINFENREFHKNKTFFQNIGKIKKTLKKQKLKNKEFTFE
jgi:hypothetical protein